VRVAFERALAVLRGLGAETVAMPTVVFDIEPLLRVINHTSWRGRFAAMAASDADRMSPSLLRQLALAEGVDAVAFQQAMFERTALFRRVQALLSEHQVLAMPTLSRTALPIEQDLFGAIEIDGRSYPEVRANWFPWTMPFNLTGHPAITLPCGFDAQGLPIGLQLVGRFRQDAALLRTAALFEVAMQRCALWPGVAEPTRRT
jgi:aspartyl-tRNA(Asn)/glutamyl-tRNA(Gln) amidotransferase subunit A